MNTHACPLNSAGFVARFCYHLGRGPDDHSYGTQFYGTDGTLFINREGYTIWPAAPIRTCGKLSAVRYQKGDGTAQHQPHVVNFLDCLRSRKMPNSDIETTHRTTSVCTWRIFRCAWDGNCAGIAKNEQFIGDADANKMLNEARRKPWDVI